MRIGVIRLESVDILILFPYFFAMQATLTSKGQVTIPVRVRKRLNLRPGDKLQFDEQAPFLKATKAIAPDAWDKFRAAWKNLYGKRKTSGNIAVKAVRGNR